MGIDLRIPWARACLLVVACVLLSACGAERRPTSPGLNLSVQPVDARVYVDDAFVGNGRTLLRQTVLTSTGTHYIVIKARGHFPHHLRLVLRPGVTRVRVKLRPIPP